MFSIPLIFIKYKKAIIKKPKIQKIIKIIFLIGLIFQQITFIYFSFFIKGDGIIDGLPLYTCRITVYVSIFALVLNSNKLKTVTIIWGIVGGILAMLVPDLHPYKWPHILYMNFFLTHILIFAIGMYFLLIEEVRPNTENKIFTYKFANIFLIMTLALNYILNTNYSYLRISPVYKDFFLKFNPILYAIFVIALYNIEIFIIMKIYEKICGKTLKNTN